MAATSDDEGAMDGWTVVTDPENAYSTGIPQLDRLLGGGLPRGGLALFQTDGNVSTDEWDLLLTPAILNFLHQSRGMLAVLPARDSPHRFRTRLLRYTTPRRFDARVRVIDYVGEEEDAPYIVRLGKGDDKRKREEMMRRMVVAEQAATGRRKHPYLELNAFEVLETYVGAEHAAKMFLFGVKRAREVGNPVLGLLRPGLACTDAVRGMADIELSLRKGELGLTIEGLRPRFPPHLVVPHRTHGLPQAELIPAA